MWIMNETHVHWADKVYRVLSRQFAFVECRGESELWVTVQFVVYRRNWTKSETYVDWAGESQLSDSSVCSVQKELN